jgi:hypothetical protein
MGMITDLIMAPPRLARGASTAVAGSVVKSFGNTWEHKGWGTATRRAVGMGALFGGLSAAVDMGLNRPASNMGFSQEGSAYGTDGFGARKTNVRALGESTSGLVGGLHNSR